MARSQGIRSRWVRNNLLVVALILLVALAAFLFLVNYLYRANLTDQLAARAEASARLFESYAAQTEDSFYAGATRYAADFVDKDKMEFEVVGPNGYVLCSSFSTALAGFRPGTPDVRRALEEQRTVSYVGRDSLTGQRVMSVSTPVWFASGELAGALRYVTGMERLRDRIVSIGEISALVVVLIFLFVAFSGVYFIRSIVNPIANINAATKRIAAGEYGARIAKSRDDEIGELADSVNFMSGEIERSTKIKNEFISSVSHELRTPLTAIGGWAETLLQGEPTDPLEKRGLEVIVQEAARLRDIVEELLDFSRIESGRLAVQCTAMDLKAELADTILMMEQRLAQDRMHVRYTDAVDGPAMISGDRGRLRQVFVNLIDNARKASQPGTAIDITVARRENGFAVTVADHGCGISPEDLPHVKEKFYKGDPSKPGSGIGLALCDEILRQHGAPWRLESTLGEGTTVTLLFYQPGRQPQRDGQEESGLSGSGQERLK